MYNEIIASKLSDLKYLFALKKANVSIISKKNNFNDIVKFFAQINAENVIQKISFKATGCSTFFVMCSYFCELVEGKTIEDALKITSENLLELTSLNSSKEHVFPIILDTFKLLIKKYQKGIEKGKILPCDKIDDNVEIKSNVTTEKKLNIISDLDDIIEIKNPKKESKRIGKDSNTKKKAKIDSILSTSELKNKNQTFEENKVEIIIPEVDNSKIDQSDYEEHILHVKEEIKITETTVNDNNENKKVIEERKTSHLMALRQKINSKKNNDKAHKNADTLSNMLKLFGSSSNQTNDLDKKTDSEENNKDIDNKSSDKKQKKSLFSWLKKKY